MGTSLIRNRTALGLCLGPYGGPGGGAVSYELGTPVSLRTPVPRVMLQGCCARLAGFLVCGSLD
jgi:hypothetical protein